jgi:CRISPR/Cas system-associated exonuclease Cas4 (RecB family)
MATARTGKPYFWVTWLTGLLGGNSCLWSAWFKSRFKYQKFELEARDLAEWSRDHNRMMRDRKVELEECGWTVTTEDQNAFKLEGQTAIVAGKPDLVATMPGHVLVIDGKTGRERDSDWWQVLFYLFALPIARPDLTGDLRGEIHYKRGDKRVPIRHAELTAARHADIVQLLKIIASATPPSRSPSRHECQRCNIGFTDCPDRFRERASVTTAVSGF